MVMAHTARQRHSMPSALPSSSAVATCSTSSFSSSSSSAVTPVSKYQLLRRLLTRIQYSAPFSAEQLLSHCPPSLTLPMLSHLFLSFSPHLTHYFLSHNFLLSSSSFSLSALYSLLLHLFQYRPPLSQAQFSSERGFVALKLTLLTDVISLCIRKHDDLVKEMEDQKPLTSLPRVASLPVSHPSHAPQEKENRPRPSAPQADGKARRKKKQPLPPSPLARLAEATASSREAEATPMNPNHISFTSQGSTPPSFGLQVGAGHDDPLLSIHAQLRSIAHRTSLHGTPPSTPPQRGGGYEEVVRRLEAVERRVSEEVRGLQEKLAEVTSRLQLLEGRVGSEEKEMDEAVQRAETAGEQQEAGGEKSGAEQAEVSEAKEQKEEVKEAEVQRAATAAQSAVVAAVPTSGEADDFLSHMQARLAATASLLDQAKRTRRSNGMS